MFGKQRRKCAGIALSSLAVGLASAASARAQQEGQRSGEVSEGATGAVPPKLLTLGEAVYPPEVTEPPRGVAVLLRITVDTNGNVTAAEVLESAGPPLDEVARDALLRSRFAPATKAGSAVGARVAFRYEFPAPARAVAPQAPDAPAPTAPPSAVGPSTLPAPAVAEPMATPPAAPAPIEVAVEGERSRTEKLRRSAMPVTVVNLNRQKKRSADLGEILARTYGAAVRRSGALGSDTRFSLNGLQEDQLRLFLNGIPLEHGFPFGVANIPVNLLDSVEIYRGVVPVRFASDALGGAVNFVTDQTYATRAMASYQVGSYGTHRATLAGRYRFDNGFVIGVESFFDAALNDYDVDVKIADAHGNRQKRRVPRFHDRYDASGVAVDAGVVDVPWARRLVLRGLTSGYDKELQHNVVMSVPYGEVTYGETLRAVQARYEHTPVPGLQVELLGSYGHRTMDFSDESAWVYDWFGRRVRRRITAGEIDTRPRDQTIWQHGVFVRAGADLRLGRGQSLRLASSSDYATRTGDERRQLNPNGRDPLSAEQEMFKQITGVEYELNAFGRQRGGLASGAPQRPTEHVVQNVLFAKHYSYEVNSEEILPGGVFRARDLDRSRFGIGDGLRVMLADWLYVKGSYEYSTRLPRTDEVFGDGALVHPNLELVPEISHNANLGAHVALERSAVGDLTVDLNAFVRDTDRQILLLGTDRYFEYKNLFSSRSRGVEGSFEWYLVRRAVAFDGSFTWLDQRNTSERGPFSGPLEGDRLPNRPWLSASAGARVRVPRIVDPGDELEPFYTLRYGHEYYRGWESVGGGDTKHKVASQLTHGAGVTYLVRRPFGAVWSTFEVQNLTDELVFDFYGQERPGRGFYLKLTAQL